MRRGEPSPFQRVLNGRRPPRAWAIPERPHTQWVCVRCRVEWERDGVEWVDAFAKSWTDRHVFVTWPDRRLYGGGVWLSPRDVTRR